MESTRLSPGPINALRDNKYVKSHLIQALQVHQIIIRTALYYQGFTSIDPLVPVWSQGHDNASERSKVTSKWEETALRRAERKARSIPRYVWSPSSSPGGHQLTLSRAVIALHLCFDLSLSNEAQWPEVNVEPAGYRGLWKSSGDPRESVKERHRVPDTSSAANIQVKSLLFI